MKRVQLAGYQAGISATRAAAGWRPSGSTGLIAGNRSPSIPYGELRDLFREMCYATDIKAIVFTGEGGNFCSGGDVHEIIGPLVKMDMPELLESSRA